MKTILLFILPILAFTFEIDLDTNRSGSATQIHMEEKLYPLKKGAKYGFINTKGEWVIEPEFEDAHSFNNNGSASVKVNGKWGYINIKSEWILKPQFDDISIHLYHPWVQYVNKSLVKSLIKVQMDSKWGIVNTRKAEIIINPQFDDIHTFDENGLAEVELNGKRGLINTKGEIVVELKFNSISDFSENGLAEVELNGKWGYINTKGEIIVEPKFDSTHSLDENGFAQVELNGKWGVLNSKGKWILEPQFDEAVEFAKNGLALVLLDGRYGFINTKGKWVIEPQFDDAKDFKGSLTTIVKLNGKWGIINTEGKWVIEPQLQFEDIDISDIYSGVISVTHNGKISIVNAKGKWITKLKFDEILGIDDAGGRVDMNGWIKVRLDKKWGVIDIEGNWIFKPRFDDVGYFSVVDMIVAKYNGKWGLIDARGKWVLKPQFDSIGIYGDSGRGIVEYNGKWGLINDEGEWILKPLFYNFFDIAYTYFMSKTGLLKIGKYDDKKGVMDRKANWILKQKFDDVEILDDLIYVKYGDLKGYTSLDGKYLTFTKDELHIEKLKKDCNDSDASACYELAHKYDKGQSMKTDKSGSKSLLWENCKQGDGEGCYNLGAIYAYELSERYDAKDYRHYPFVCYREKSKNETGKITYLECIRSDVKCSSTNRIHFGEYPNDLKAHKAFVRCSKGDPKFVDPQKR